ATPARFWLWERPCGADFGRGSAGCMGADPERFAPKLPEPRRGLKMHPRNRTYLRLEVLEDRTTPASVPAPVVATLSQANLLLSDVEAQAGLIRRLDQSFSRPSTDGVGVVTLAELQAVSSASLPASFQVALLPGLLLLSSTGQAQPGT